MIPSVRRLALVLIFAGACFKDAPLADTSATATDSPDDSTSTPSAATTSTASTSSTAGTETTALTSDDLTDSDASPSSTGTTAPTPLCGDGVLDPGEICDDGPANGDHAACTSACMLAKCGDGLLHQGVEECDLGPDNKAGVYDGCIPTTCVKGPHCGDAIVQIPDEECDDGDQNGEAAKCSGTCVWNGKLVFATSETYSGDLAGLAGADKKCNSLATAAGLANAGAFLAWMSDGADGPSARMTHSTGRYLLVDGTLLATNWTDLTDGDLAAPIDRDEHGAPIDMLQGFAWTGATAQGTPTDPTKLCALWTDGTKFSNGRRGSLAATDFTWSSAGDWSCALPARLICVEQ